MGELINRIPGSRLAMSTSILKASPGKLEIHRHSPNILYLFGLVYCKHLNEYNDSDILYNSKIHYNVNCICTKVPVILNLNSLQQKFSLMSNYLGTNSVVVERVDCT